MAILSWGKPTIEVCKLVDGAVPAEAQWKALSEIVQGTTTLTSEQGEKYEALEEGGELVDVRYSKNKYTLEMELFIQKSGVKPIEDADGVVLDMYSVRLTPEDDSCPGFMMDKASVACTESWTSADGGRWKYTFTALKPATGKILKPYTKA